MLDDVVSLDDRKRFQLPSPAGRPVTYIFGTRSRCASGCLNQAYTMIGIPSPPGSSQNAI